MTTTQRIYVYLMVLLLIALGALWHSNGKVSKVRDLIAREQQQFEEVKGIGQLISNHKQAVAAMSEIIDSNKKGDLEMNKVLSLLKKHNLKDPATSRDNLSIKRTYSERIISLQLKDEKLKSMIEFMLDIEALGNAVVTTINISRNPKDRDLWNADLKVVQRIKKEEEV